MEVIDQIIRDQTERITFQKGFQEVEKRFRHEFCLEKGLPDLLTALINENRVLDVNYIPICEQKGWVLFHFVLF